MQGVSINTPSSSNPMAAANPSAPFIGNQFVQLLRGLMHHDNTVRSEAEQHYNNLKANYPGTLLTQLLQQLRNSDEAVVRTFSAVLLRGATTSQRNEVWSKCAPQTQVLIKQELLQCVIEEKNPQIRKKICDTIGVLGSWIGDWEELLPFCFQCTNSDNVVWVESGLEILAYIAIVVGLSGEMKKHCQNIFALFQRCLTVEGGTVGVRCRAISAFANLIIAIEQAKDRQVFRKLVPAVLTALEEIFRAPNSEDEAQECMEAMVEIADAHASFFRPHLNVILHSMLTVAGAKGAVDDNLRRLAVECLLRLAENGGAMCRKMKDNLFVESFYPVLLNVMMELKDHMYNLQVWESRENDDVDDLSNFDVVSEALDRFSKAIGSKKAIRPFFKLIGTYIHSSTWEHRYVALMSLSQVTETMPSSMLADTVGMVLNVLSNPQEDPRVRCAACNVLGVVSSPGEHGGVFQAHHHEQVVPVLLNALKDQSTRLQAHAAMAFVTFIEMFDSELLEPYLNGLLNALFDRLQHGKRSVQEHAVTAIASVAESAEGHFKQYYDIIMPVLKQILYSLCDKKDRLFRAKTLECITLIGMAVGKEKFGEDAKEVMKLMVDAQSANLDPDDPLRSYMLQAWARICSALGNDFAPYLEYVMPSLMYSAQLKAEVVLPYPEKGDEQNGNLDDEDEEDENVVTWELEDHRVKVHTSILEEKTTAVNMMAHFAKDLQLAFLPYVEAVINILKPLMLITGTVHDDLRAYALSAMPDLIRCIMRGARATQTQESHDYAVSVYTSVLEQVLRAMVTETEMDVLKTVVQCTKELVEAICEIPRENDAAKVYQTLLDENALKEINERLIQQIHNSFQRRAVRKAERAVAEDYDEEDAEQEELANESEEELQFHIAEAIGSLVKTHKQVYVPVLQQTLVAKLADMSSADMLPSDRKFALFIVDDILEYGGEAYFPLYASLIPLLIQNTNDVEYPTVRQAAVYGLRQAATHGGNAFEPFVQNAVNVIVESIMSEDAHDDYNGIATDNAVSALGQIADKHAPYMGIEASSNIIMKWMHYLPLQHDHEESITVSNHLCDMIENGRHQNVLVGQNFSNIPVLVNIFATVLCKDLVNKILRARIKTVLESIRAKVPQEVMTHVGSTLSGEQSQALRALLEG